MSKMRIFQEEKRMCLVQAYFKNKYFNRVISTHVLGMILAKWNGDVEYLYSDNEYEIMMEMEEWLEKRNLVSLNSKEFLHSL